MAPGAKDVRREAHTKIRTRIVAALEKEFGIWNVYFGPLKLGRLLEEHMRIEDANGKLKRRTARS